jgi:hypothetical protein
MFDDARVSSCYASREVASSKTEQQKQSAPGTIMTTSASEQRVYCAAVLISIVGG